MAKAPMGKLARSERRAWVTGASAGIGAAFAQRLARDGYDLALVARNVDRLGALAGRLAQRHGVHADVVGADLTAVEDVDRVAALVARDRALMLLVNNAGFGTAGAFAGLDPQREEEEIRLNVLALVRLTRAALPGLLRHRRGGIINVSSMAGFQPVPFNATYGATKAFVNSFTEALSEEVSGTGVHVQALCPGFTRTEFQERAGIDVSALPAFAWMSAEAVVDASIAGLARGDVVCVPGIANQVMTAATGALPRRAVRRLMGIASRRMLGGTEAK
jgi:short-subunit dehydrogenase